MIRDRLDAVTAVVQLPIGVEGDFRGVIDLVEMRAILWPLTDDTEGAKFEITDIPADYEAAAEKGRHELLETIAHVDDALLEKYLGDEPISADEIRHAIRLGTLKFEFVPVLCGSAFKNRACSPCPAVSIACLAARRRDPGHRHEGRPIERKRASTSRSALAFKIKPPPTAAHVFRIYCGNAGEGG
jgi:elongation factor G